MKVRIPVIPPRGIRGSKCCSTEEQLEKEPLAYCKSDEVLRLPRVLMYRMRADQTLPPPCSPFIITKTIGRQLQMLPILSSVMLGASHVY